MPFPCPACGARVAREPGRLLLGCPACGARLRARAAGSTPTERLYDVEALGRPETRQRVAVAWSGGDERRLRRWLAWASLVTVGLVGVLWAAAALLG